MEFIKRWKKWIPTFVAVAAWMFATVFLLACLIWRTCFAGGDWVCILGTLLLYPWAMAIVYGAITAWMALVDWAKKE